MKYSFPLFFLLLVLANRAVPMPLTHGDGQPYAERCIRSIINCDYGTAFSIADSVMAEDAADPLPYLLRLTALGVRDIDFDTLIDSAAFLIAYRTTNARITAYESAHGASSYTTMLAGFSRWFHSAFHLRKNSYYAAMRTGFQSLDLLEDAYRLDSTNADPLFLLGLYKYAKGELKRRLWWILFWYPGSKKTGIERLESCMRNGRLTASASRFALAEIYLREKQPDECARLLKSLERDFPDSRFTLWAKAKFFESQRLYYEAGQVYELLAVSYDAEPAGGYNALFTRSLQAQMLLKSGQKKEAADICRAVLRETASGREKKVYDGITKLLQRINDGESP